MEAYESLRSMPPVWRTYVKALTPGRSKASKEPTLPERGFEVAPTVISAPDLRRYRRVCELPEAGTLPLTYPQVFGVGLFGHLVTQDDFPFPAMGVVHLRNRIEQHGPIGVDEAIGMRARPGELRDVDAGWEIDVHQQATVGGEVRWEATLTALFRRKQPRTRKHHRDPLKSADELGYDLRRTLDVPENTGRRYARASGDYNPIHLWPWSAKLLGFRRQIVHGLWTLARVLGELEAATPAGHAVYEAAFKTPVFLPARIRLLAQTGGDAIPFEVRNESEERPHVEGRLGSTSDPA